MFLFFCQIIHQRVMYVLVFFQIILQRVMYVVVFCQIIHQSNICFCFLSNNSSV